MHTPSEFSHRVQLRIIEHLAEFLKFVFWVIVLFFTAFSSNSLFSFPSNLRFFFIEHAPESFEISTRFDEPADVDLGTEVVA